MKLDNKNYDGFYFLTLATIRASSSVIERHVVRQKFTRFLSFLDRFSTFFTLMMETIWPSEMSVKFYETTCRHIPEDSTLEILWQLCWHSTNHTILHETHLRVLKSTNSKLHETESCFINSESLRWLRNVSTFTKPKSMFMRVHDWILSWASLIRSNINTLFL
jgi:hypothetical protein